MSGSSYFTHTFAHILLTPPTSYIHISLVPILDAIRLRARTWCLGLASRAVCIGSYPFQQLIAHWTPLTRVACRCARSLAYSHPIHYSTQSPNPLFRPSSPRGCASARIQQLIAYFTPRTSAVPLCSVRSSSMPESRTSLKTSAVYAVGFTFRLSLGNVVCPPSSSSISLRSERRATGTIVMIRRSCSR